MVTILSRHLFPIIILVISLFLLLVGAYNKGYSNAETRFQKEKLELIVKKELEKEAIIAKIREKSPIERRKELGRYVIK